MSEIKVRRIARIQVRRHTYRGVEGWRIVGEDARGRKVRIFSSKEEEARRMAREIREGREPSFDVELQHPQRAAALRGWETRRARIAEVLSKVDELAEYARATAAGLRLWQLSQRPQAICTGNEIHPMHAANRLDKLAEQLTSSTKGNK